MTYSRKCPKCGKELIYELRSRWNRAERQQSCCRSCGMDRLKVSKKRNCPRCGKELIYKRTSGIGSARKANSLCRECATSDEERCSHLSRLFSGNSNPFYGHAHDEETKKSISLALKGKKTGVNADKAHRGSLNPMYGKSVYSVWVKKYGEEEANKRSEQYRLKQQVNSTGSKNPMYGKPAPHGSGGGWSGWYKGWYFRSLKELSYVIYVLEKEGHTWETAEQNKLSVPYVDNKGSIRTYRADFLVDGVQIVEVKPIRMMDTSINKAKYTAAVEFFSSRGLRYSMIDVPCMPFEELLRLYEQGIVTFTGKYQERMENRRCKSATQQLLLLTSSKTSS